jgi:hypothetical protein
MVLFNKLQTSYIERKDLLSLQRHYDALIGLLGEEVEGLSVQRCDFELRLRYFDVDAPCIEYPFEEGDDFHAEFYVYHGTCSPIVDMARGKPCFGGRRTSTASEFWVARGYSDYIWRNDVAGYLSVENSRNCCCVLEQRAEEKDLALIGTSCSGAVLIVDWLSMSQSKILEKEVEGGIVINGGIPWENVVAILHIDAEQPTEVGANPLSRKISSIEVRDRDKWRKVLSTQPQFLCSRYLTKEVIDDLLAVN